ncbi:MAG: hypothetical protein HQ518_13575 [Rhodopirellula sp.]|nr:hypothetical protein [Rhodopirellula sp.]
MKQFLPQLSAIMIVTGLVIAGGQTISEARDLFQLVDQDAVACLHVRNLDAQWQRLRESEFSARLKRAAFFRDWLQSPDYEQLKLVTAAVEAASGKSIEQSRRELFSQDAVLAWYHTPGTKADLARNSVLLIEVESPAAAQSALATWNLLERQRTDSRKYRDVTYTHSVKASSDKDVGGFWYAILDNVLALSVREDRIQRTIELAAEASVESTTNEPGESAGVGHADCLASYEPFAKAFARRSKTELAAVYMNPRVLGSELSRANRDFSIFEDSLARCRWLTLSLTYDESIQLDLVADYDNTGAPDWWRQWLDVATTSRPTQQPFPPNTLLAMSGRVASSSISELILSNLQSQSELPKELIRARRVAQGLLLGLDPVADVLLAIGPSWVFRVESRDPAVSTSFPVDSLLAIELNTGTTSPNRTTSPEDDGGNVEVSPEAALDNSLRVGLSVLAAVHNAHATGQKVSVVRQRKVNGATIHFADPVAFFQPAFVISAGQLVLATSPDLCESFLKSPRADHTPNQSRDENSRTQSGFDTLASQPTGNLQNLMANAVVARQILKQQREWFIRQAKRDHVPEADAQRRLEELDQFLQLLDRAWLTASVDQSTVRISAGIAADKPANQ